MQPIQLFDPATGTYTYILFDEASRKALIIDPVDEQIERDLGVLRQFGLNLIWAVETHTHADHVTSAAQLAELAGAQTATPGACGIETASVQLQDGNKLWFGGEHIRALHTPGHTAGSMSYLWRDHVFTGDCLLINGCGRTDLQTGDSTALYQSLTQILFALPDATTVWPGHDYEGRSKSSIGVEKAHNERIGGKTLDEFLAIMQGLRLPRPKHLDEVVSTNLRLGLRHDTETVPLQDARPAPGYAGDVSPQLAYQWWQADQAVLVDIRSDAERAWVGFVPGAVALAWKQWPGMTMNARFDEDLKAAVPQGKKVLLLCRSGVRSIAAAKRASELGLQAYNVLEGFEGDPDAHAQRGRQGGWRFQGLPWRQS